MTNYTPYYWDWDNVSLETWAHGIEEFTGGRIAPPPLRGGNRIVPGAEGRIWRAKVPDSRQVILTMWINGADANGVIVDEAEWRYNVYTLVNTLYDPDAQHDLGKRIPSNSTGGILRVVAKAQYVDGLIPEIAAGEEGLQVARMSVTFELADPWFYDGATKYV